MRTKVQILMIIKLDAMECLLTSVINSSRAKYKTYFTFESSSTRRSN